MSYCVVPRALADEPDDRLAEHPRDDPNVEVIIDRRGQVGETGDHPAFEDRRRQRSKGSFPPIEAPASA